MLSPARLEAFSDAVLAIIITITVLELKVPESGGLAALTALWPLFIAYLISFQTVGTYWNNHHHLIRATKHVSADIMWANLNLLFWLSLIPFAAGWLGKNPNAAWPTAVYSAVLLLSAGAYTILQLVVVQHAEKKAQLVKEMKASPKGIISLVSYAIAVFCAFYSPTFSYLLILFVAILWFIPDKRIEKNL